MTDLTTMNSDALEDVIAALRALQDAYEKELAALNEQIAALTSENQELTEQAAVLTAQIAELEAEIAELEKQLEDATLPPTTEPPIVPPIVPPTTTLRPGIFVDHDVLVKLPVSGKAWTGMLATARTTGAGGGQIANQDGGERGREILAIALAGVRLGDQALIDKAITAITATIGSEKGGRWLAVGRTFIPYIVAASVLRITRGPIYDWIKSYRTKTLSENNPPKAQITFAQDSLSSGSNASVQSGLGYAALLVYLDDKPELDKEYIKFRRYLGDRSSTHKLIANNSAWQSVPGDPIGIQNVGARSLDGIDIAGAISNDMVRSNPKPVANLVFVDHSHYPWVGLNAAVLLSKIYQRQGYPAFELADKAIYRAASYLLALSKNNGGGGWYDDSSRKDAKFVINDEYGVPYPLALPVATSGLVGWMDWLLA